VTETLYRGKILTLERLDSRWEVVRHAAAVAVLAIDGGRVVGVRQRRPAIGGETWELPAGLVDPGEQPEEAAARELAEEVRLAGTLTPLTRLYPSPGFCDELVYLYRAEGLVPAYGERDQGEDLAIEWRDPEQVWADAAAGRLATSGVTLLGIRHALALLAEGA
jgi:ADP-ribose pyrophosphatase